MSSNGQPLVTVLTPVYNMGSYLGECIESVLRQTYSNYEYIVVNNCSTDNSLEIATKYAQRDPRIRIHNNSKFVGVIENHNSAFRLMSPSAKYCKVVSADDFLFSDCIGQMVELAESNPSVGIVGSYQISGNRVRWQGLEYPKTVFPGREICRLNFLGTDNYDGFGNPTSLLYRADLVRSSGDFYPNDSPHADTSACHKYLQNSDYGFVHQILSFGRVHNNRQSARSGEMNRYSSAMLNDIKEYGHSYLNDDEYKQIFNKILHTYYRYLAINMLASRDKEFWDYHTNRLQELGYPISRFILIKTLIIDMMRELLNPEQAIRKALKRLS